jgi:hypothetical protein
MILLNLILIILIIIMLKGLEAFTYIIKYFSFTFNGEFINEINHNDNNSFVFIKPENLSKTELVEKYKELSSSKSLNDLKDKKEEKDVSIKDLFKSYFSKISSFVLKFYGILTKITLFTILIRYFRKIKLIRFILTMINSVILSLFGIVFSDVYGFKEFFDFIKDY